jgi:hypothetical protein
MSTLLQSSARCFGVIVAVHETGPVVPFSGVVM